MSDGLKDKHRKAVIEILAANEHVERVILFGSRAMGTFTTTSDVDLALYGDSLTLTDQAKLATAMDELPMAQRVDLLLYNKIDNKNLKEHIQKHGKEWFCRGRRVSADWTNTTWGKLIELKYGKAFRGYKDSTGEFPVYGTNGPVGWCDKPLCNFPSVIIGRKGAYRGVHYSDKPFFVIDTAYFVSPKSDINLKWAYYQLLTQNINNLDSGSAIPSTSREDVYQLAVNVPPKEIQNEIVKILDCLNDKIEINRQINQTLEEMAQVIFKSWFVDFEPVKAKIEAKTNGQDPERAAMCAISGKTDAELDHVSPDQLAQLRNTAALFPDELTDSELGPIPVGWKSLPLSQLVHLIGGGTPKRSIPEYWNGEIPWFSVQDAPDKGDVFVVDAKEKITKFGLDKSSTKLLPIGTTIISARGTVGRLALIGTEMVMNQSCYGVLGVDGIGKYFNFFNLQKAVGVLQQNTHGAVFDTITRQRFETVQCIKPTNAILSAFEMIVLPLMEKIQNNLHQRISLTQLRHSLLPKLLSGEISANGAESVIKEKV